jgi:hypothetical protein
MQLMRAPDQPDDEIWSVASHPLRAELAAIGSTDDPRDKIDAYRRAAASSDTLPVAVDAPQISVPDIPSATPHTPRVIKVPNLTDVRKRQFYSDLGISLIVFVVAVIAGLQLLYINNNTWGTGTDIAIAILWGLGLHQISGQSLNGYASIRQQALNPPTS